MAVAEREKMIQLLRAIQSFETKGTEYSLMLDKAVEDYCKAVENDDLSITLTGGIASARKGDKEGVGEAEIAKQAQALAERIAKDTRDFFNIPSNG